MNNIDHGNMSSSGGASTPSLPQRDIDGQVDLEATRNSHTIADKLHHTWAVSLAQTMEAPKATVDGISGSVSEKQTSKASEKHSSV